MGDKHFFLLGEHLKLPLRSFKLPIHFFELPMDLVEHLMTGIRSAIDTGRRSRLIDHGDLLFTVGRDQLIGLGWNADRMIRLLNALRAYLRRVLLSIAFFLIGLTARVLRITLRFVGFAPSVLLLTPCLLFGFATLGVRLASFVFCFAFGLIHFATCFFRLLLCFRFGVATFCFGLALGIPRRLPPSFRDVASPRLPGRLLTRAAAAIPQTAA